MIKNRKVNATIALIGGVSLFLAGCGANSGTPDEGASSGKATGTQGAPTAKEFTSFKDLKVYKPAAELLPADVKGKKIVIALDPTSAPTRFIGSDGETVVGFDADMGRALGQVLGVDIEFKETTFDGLIPGLQAKRFDVALSDMGVTEDRLKVLDMVGYALGGEAIVTAPGNPLSIGPDSMCGHKIAVMQGGLQTVERGPKRSAACVKKGEPPINLLTLPSQNDELLQLKSGRVDAVYADGPALSWAAKNSPGDFEKVADISTSILSMGVLKDSPLTPALVEAMKHLATLPAYAESTKRWGLSYVKLNPDAIKSYKTPPTPPEPAK